MKIVRGPKYRQRCEGTTVWTASSDRTYCESCGDCVELRKDGKPRAHYRIISRLHITGLGF
jgi:hypothetical protein